MFVLETNTRHYHAIFFNKNEDALEIYKLLAQANPQMAEPLINQAHLSVGDKKYDLAINLYEIVL